MRGEGKEDKAALAWEPHPLFTSAAHRFTGPSLPASFTSSPHRSQCVDWAPASEPPSPSPLPSRTRRRRVLCWTLPPRRLARGRGALGLMTEHVNCPGPGGTVWAPSRVPNPRPSPRPSLLVIRPCKRAWAISADPTKRVPPFTEPDPHRDSAHRPSSLVPRPWIFGHLPPTSYALRPFTSHPPFPASSRRLS